MMKVIIFFCLLSVSLGLPQTHLHTIFLQPKDRPDYLTSRKSIINGNEASPHQFPYQVGMFIQNTVNTDFCGGSFISPNYVLTAAHCVDHAIQATLVFGAHQITTTESTQVRVVSKEFIIHSDWNSNEFNKNDIALIKLSSSLAETSAIKIINITTGSDTYEKQSSVVAGWGLTKNSQTGITPILRYITPNIISNTDCKNVDADYDAIVSDTLMCISADGYKGTCQGDSGGPLAVNGVQVGIVSFGSSNCEEGKPSVFTRLTKYTDWIAQNSDVKF